MEPSFVASDWYIDSGATNHMSSNASNLSSITPYTGNSLVSVGNGNSIPISAVGDAQITPMLQLSDVLLVPAITKNLLSISKLTRDLGVSISFDDRSFVIQHKVTKAVLGRGHSKDGLYVLDRGEEALLSFVRQNNNRASFETWHARLGHVSVSTISLLNKNGFLSVTSVLPKPSICEPCIMAKGHKLSFADNLKRADHVLNLIHCDLWGPSPVLSGNGFSYYAIFVDDHSRFSWLYPLRQKSDFVDVYLKFEALVENQLSSRIKVFQSDGGMEFLNSRLQTHFGERGIHHQVSCPYTPEQNGRAERKHRHVTEMGLSMLFHSHMPLSYWDDAFAAAVYTINRLPTPVLDNISPFEVLFGRTPLYSNFHPFGCRVFPFVRSTAAHKLAPRSLPCVFLGYSAHYKGFRCLDPNSGRIYMTRHARFDETCFPFSTTSSEAQFSSLDVSSFLDPDMQTLSTSDNETLIYLSSKSTIVTEPPTNEYDRAQFAVSVAVPRAPPLVVSNSGKHLAASNSGKTLVVSNSGRALVVSHSSKHLAASNSGKALVVSNSEKKLDPSGKKKYVKQVTGKHNDTELHLAAQRGDVAAVRQIIDDINEHMLKTLSGAEFDEEVAEIRSAVVNEVNELGETALFTAVERGHIEVVRQLLPYTTKVGITAKNRSGFDPLHIASSQGHHAIVQLLLDHDPELCKTVGQSNTTPLISAATKCHVSVVQELLSRDSSLLELTKSNGKNALHFAVRQGHVEIVKALLDKDPQLARRTDRKGQTSLHMAVKGVSSPVVRLLLKADPTIVNLPDRFGNTALHVATRKKRGKIVNELLMIRDTNVNALSRAHKTPLDIAEGLHLSEEIAEIKEQLAQYGAVRANDLNQPRDELRKTVTEIKKDVHSQLEQARKTNRNMNGIAKELRKLHREGINNATNSVTVVAVLFATVAFTAIFTVPGGDDSTGRAVMVGSTSFQVFFLANAVALFTSLAVVLVQITVVRREIRSERRVIEVINKLMWLASICTTVAFIASSYIVVGRRNKWAAILVTVIGGVIMAGVLGTMTFYVFKYRRMRRVRKREKSLRISGPGRHHMSDQESDVNPIYAL